MATTRDLPSAVVTGDAKLVERILDEGGDINQRSKDGMTAIGLASFWGYANIVDLLLRNGADVNSTNHGTLWTPLHCATFQGHGPVVMKLLKYKPTLDVTDMRGRTPTNFASANDAIWPFFNALGCKRTPKSELLQMDIVYQAQNDIITEGGSTAGYGLIEDQYMKSRDSSQSFAFVTGDVLADENDSDHLYRTPTVPSFNAYRT